MTNVRPPCLVLNIQTFTVGKKHEEMVARKILFRIDQALQIPQFEKVCFELFR